LDERLAKKAIVDWRDLFSILKLTYVRADLTSQVQSSSAITVAASLSHLLESLHSPRSFQDCSILLQPVVFGIVSDVIILTPALWRWQTFATLTSCSSGFQEVVDKTTDKEAGFLSQSF
jgi:hypothetical protein